MPSDYLDELPPMPPSQLHDSELVRLELERVARGEALAAMDLERYNLNPPGSSQSSDPAAWQAALDNAHAQLEHQLNRLLNLELLVKYGPVTWRAHNEAVASYVSRLEGEVAAARGAIDELNRERKLQQTAAGRELATLQEEYLTLVAKNAELEAVCCRIEAQADELQAKVPEGAAIADGPQNDAMR